MWRTLRCAVSGALVIWLADVFYETILVGLVKLELRYSDKATPVAEVARRSGATSSFRQAFAFVGSYLSRHVQTMAYGVSFGARTVLPSSTVDRWISADGGTLELVRFDCDEASVGQALILPGLCGDVSGSSLAIASCIEHNLQPVVFHRRGDGAPLSSARFNIFGDLKDLDEAVARMQQNRRPVAIFASSAGTGLLVRWLGDRGCNAPVVAAFANCPGYDIGVALTRCSWLYDVGFYIARIKAHYCSRNRRILEAADPVTFRRCMVAPTTHSFMVAAAPYAGYSTYSEYLLGSNPMVSAHRITTPLLIVNANDDPICTRHNVDDHLSLFNVSPSAVLVRTSRGGHCGFYARQRTPPHIYPWAHNLGARFLAAYCAAALPEKALDGCTQ